MDSRHPTPEACAQLVPHQCVVVQGERFDSVVFLYELLSGGWAVGAVTLPDELMSIRAWGGPSCDIAEGLEQYAQLVRTSQACLGAETVKDAQLTLAQEVELTAHWANANQWSTPVWSPDSYESWKLEVCRQAAERNRALYGPSKGTTELLLSAWQLEGHIQANVLKPLSEGEMATIVLLLLEADLAFPEGTVDGLRTLRDYDTFDFCQRLGGPCLKALQGCIDAVLWHRYRDRSPRVTVGDLVATLLRPHVPVLLTSPRPKTAKA